MEHVCDRYSLDPIAFETILCNGIDISFYVSLLDIQSQEYKCLFYNKFNKLLESVGISGKYISSHLDIVDKAHVLCWIYYIQDSFL